LDLTRRASRAARGARQLAVYRSLLSPRTLKADDLLDGEDVLPGFSGPVIELFED